MDGFTALPDFSPCSLLNVTTPYQTWCTVIHKNSRTQENAVESFL